MTGKKPKPDKALKLTLTMLEQVGAYLDEQLGEERTERTDAADHLRAYLVSRGLPSDPVKLDDPHLDALARALL